MRSPTRSPGAFAIAIAAALWGTTGTAAHAMPAAVGPLAIGAATMGIGGILLFAFTAPRAVAALRAPDSRRWVLLGALGVVVYPLAFYTGMALAGVAIGNVVALGSGPVFAALLERMIDRRALTRRWMLSTAIAIAGVIAIAASGGAGMGESMLPGVLLALLAGLAYAFYTYCSSRALAGAVSSGGAVGAMFGVGAVVLVPVLIVLGGAILRSGLAIGLTAYLAIGPMAIAYLLFGAGLRTVRSSTATTIALLEPVVATVLAVVVVGERLAPLGWIGIVLILVGVSVVLPSRRDRSARQSP